ncbi:MAG: translation initiation factor IF-2, partial [Parasphingorhabdus sp.]
MAEVKIKQFAEQIRIDPERLLEQLAAAGVTASSVDDSLSEEDKKKLLGYLKGDRPAEEAKAKNRITLKRKTTSEIKQTSKTG